jgi:CheY-like chemotaxis protein
MRRFLNLKSRLMVLIALVPVILLILYSDVKHRRSIETDIRNDLSSLSFLAKDNLNKFFDTTRLLLITLSQTAEVQKGSYASNSAFFRNLHKNYPDYVNIGMADLEGNLVCSVLPMTRPINSPAAIALFDRDMKYIVASRRFLMDIQLPVMDGYAVAEELRKNPALDVVPIVAVTSYAMMGDRERVLVAGCTGHIEKPINPETFIKDIEKYL